MCVCTSVSSVVCKRGELCEVITGVPTFLAVPAAELVSDLGPSGLPQQDLDEEGVLRVGGDHHFLNV